MKRGINEQNAISLHTGEKRDQQGPSWRGEFGAAQDPDLWDGYMSAGQHLIKYIQVLKPVNICNLHKWQNNTIQTKMLRDKTKRVLRCQIASLSVLKAHGTLSAFKGS